MSLGPGGFLGGARSRLLPPSIPFRFFVAAAAFHVLAWAVLLSAGDELADFAGGVGPPLAAVHLLTLGVLTMTAVGAAFQLLPVATSQPLVALWPTRVVSWIYVPGVVAIASGMAAGNHHWLTAGGLATTLGLVVWAVVVADNLRRARGMPLVVSHAWTAVASLLVLVVLAIVIIANQEHGFLDDPLKAAALHMIFAAYGFMTMLAVGFSHLLVPMLALAPVPPIRPGFAVLIAAWAAILLAVLGIWADSGAAVAGAGGVGVAAAAGYVWAMAAALRRRMRKRLDSAFALMAVAWAFLILSPALGAAAGLGYLGERGAALFGYALLVGWLLSFVLAILQRIAPFLASMHASRANRPPALVSALTPRAPLRVHLYCHLAALAAVGAGIAAGQELLIRGGALVGTVGALAFGWFLVAVVVRMHGAAADDGGSD